MTDPRPADPSAARPAGPLAILIGPMAAGKTSVGKALAARLGVAFADLDALIVRAEGRSIPEIFAADGEKTFRALEADALARALDEHGGILSLGGGAPLTPASAERLRGRPVVLLEIDERIVAQRLGTGADRPMLAGEDPLTRWRAVTSQRMEAYRDLAPYRIDAGQGSPALVARAIARILQLDTPSRVPEETE